jgi:hypothetical protein
MCLLYNPILFMKRSFIFYFSFLAISAWSQSAVDTKCALDRVKASYTRIGNSKPPEKLEHFRYVIQMVEIIKDREFFPENSIVHVMGPGKNFYEWVLFLLFRPDIKVVIFERDLGGNSGHGPFLKNIHKGKPKEERPRFTQGNTPLHHISVTKLINLIRQENPILLTLSDITEAQLQTAIDHQLFFQDNINSTHFDPAKFNQSHPYTEVTPVPKADVILMNHPNYLMGRPVSDKYKDFSMSNNSVFYGEASPIANLRVNDIIELHGNPSLLRLWLITEFLGNEALKPAVKFPGSAKQWIGDDFWGLRSTFYPPPLFLGGALGIFLGNCKWLLGENAGFKGMGIAHSGQFLIFDRMSDIGVIHSFHRRVINRNWTAEKIREHLVSRDYSADEIAFELLKIEKLKQLKETDPDIFDENYYRKTPEVLTPD